MNLILSFHQDSTLKFKHSVCFHWIHFTCIISHYNGIAFQRVTADLHWDHFIIASLCDNRITIGMFWNCCKIAARTLSLYSRLCISRSSTNQARKPEKCKCITKRKTLDVSCSWKETICVCRSFATGMKVNQESLKEIKYLLQVRFTYIHESTYTKMQMDLLSVPIEANAYVNT